MARAIVGDYVIPIGLRYLDQKEMENYSGSEKLRSH